MLDSISGKTQVYCQYFAYFIYAYDYLTGSLAKSISLSHNEKVYRVGFYTPVEPTDYLSHAFVTFTSTESKECIELYDFEKYQDPIQICIPPYTYSERITPCILEQIRGTDKMIAIYNMSNSNPIQMRSFIWDIKNLNHETETLPIKFYGAFTKYSLVGARTRFSVVLLMDP